MRAVDVIVKKRDGQELSKEEIDFFIGGFTRGEISDYQASAWAMAVLFQGMTPRETMDLTNALIESGERLDLTGVVPIAVDKHSTGGVGDKTTLVVQPIVAACNIPMGKMSGKALAFTGGTLDKLQSISGYRIDLSTQEFIDQLKKIGLVLTGQTLNLAPADGALYSLRDVTGTVKAVPLIASSIMSKKLAAGAQAIVLDVKVGLGAFMQEILEAVELAKLMVDIGYIAGKRVVALISDMNQPLGYAVGNALEVKEALETLKGEGPVDFKEHCLEIAGHLLILAGRAKELEEGKKLSLEVLENGTAFEKFRQLVQAQGGDVNLVDDPSKLPMASIIETISSPLKGYLKEIHAREIGLSAMELGAGREKKGDAVDYAVGIVLKHKVGDWVDEGEALFEVHANHRDRCGGAVERVLAAHSFSKSKISPLPRFYQTVIHAHEEKKR
ncbi:MAG: pyrimidine-nucleoside phosphorylase [Chloroflexi bacterium RBG_16_48_8]|nr:MAG: pyrimidine-nucleoside phosphorylase [Chloroflexi bacterium RBG_16_48_8]